MSPGLAASSFISLRRAPHPPDRVPWSALWASRQRRSRTRIGGLPRRPTTPLAGRQGWAAQRNKGGGRRPGDIRGAAHPCLPAHTRPAGIGLSQQAKQPPAKLLDGCQM